MVTEQADGSVLIALDEQAKDVPVLFCYEIRGKEQIVLYLLPAGVEHQYLSKLYKLGKKMYDYVFEPYYITVSGNSQGGEVRVSGGTNPVAGSFMFGHGQTSGHKSRVQAPLHGRGYGIF